MTVDPRLQLTPGEYLIHPDGSASKVVDKHNMTVDEILASGRYTDRRGREWKRGPSFVCNRDWFYRIGIYKAGYANDAEMRLLIERDKHECDSLGLTCCPEHPVVSVIRHPDTGAWLVFDRFGIERVGPEYREWSAAMSAARALAVGE